MELKNEQLIKQWEQLRLVAYKPTPADRWTIGWGHTEDVFQGMTITKAQAEQFFEMDVQWAEDAVNTLVKVPLTQHQFDALVSFTFNIGAGAFKKSTLLRKLNAKDYKGAAHEMLRWNKQDGKVLQGLVNRRSDEMSYFMQADAQESTKVDDPGGLKSLAQSKEVWGGLSAVLTGVGAFMGGLTPTAQTTLSAALSVALVGFGAFFLINRLVARKKGQR